MINVQGFFYRLRDTLRRILADLTQLKNLESYFIAIMVILFLFATTFGEGVSENDRWNLVLAALGLLVFNLTVPRTKTKTLDDFLNDRTKLGPFPERIKDAHKLWVYAPSGSSLLRGDNVDAIRRTILAHPDGEVRAIIQNPNETASVNILRRQLDESTDYQVQHLEAELQNTLTQFELIQSWKFSGTFDYRLLAYSPGFSLVVIDPHKSSGVVIVEIHGFHNESIRTRMNVEIHKPDAERWFTYWTSQFEYMWQEAKAPLP